MERSLVVAERARARALAGAAVRGESSSAVPWLIGGGLVFFAMVSETALTLLSLGGGLYLGYLFVRFAVSETAKE